MTPDQQISKLVKSPAQTRELNVFDETNLEYISYVNIFQSIIMALKPTHDSQLEGIMEIAGNMKIMVILIYIFKYL